MLPKNEALVALLGDTSRRPWYRRKRWWAAGVALLVVGAWALGVGQSAPAAVMVTEPLARGDLTLTVTANGTLQPVRQVNIGSELSGTVKEVRVDVNDAVTQGQVLLVLDTAKLQDQVLHARAALSAAQAQQIQAEATARESKAQLARLEAVFRLSDGGLPSATDMDAARATAARSAAAVLSAQAAVDQARANLATNDTNLSKAAITSPMDGVVLSRQVDPGNAVAASLQAVTLLTLAQDLRELKLDVNVDEADIGVLEPGQRATFTVSSHPGRRYPGVVQRVAFGATQTDNVVTYTTTLDVDNSDLSLRPGMTATANIVAVERNNVLLVPNTALRFVPSVQADAAAPSLLSRMMPGGNRRAKVVRMDTRPGLRQIWVLQEGQAVPLQVTTGISDGRRTEVVGDDLAEGLLVITEQRVMK